MVAVVVAVLLLLLCVVSCCCFSAAVSLYLVAVFAFDATVAIIDVSADVLVVL